MSANKKKNITLINSLFSVLVQLLTIISGFIIPRIILKSFGSEVNGLISSLTQFLNYITLLEGGVTGVVMANLYKPLYEGDNKKISSIVYTAKKFYNKISIFFIIYTIGLSLLYPIIFNTNFSYMYVSTLTLILSLKLFIQYMFSLSLKTLLNADRKVYLVSITQIVLIVLDVVIFIVMVKFCENIHLLKLFSGLIYIVQPIIFNWYVNKNYKLEKESKEDEKLISSRWDGLAINVAAFIHHNTDITILSFANNLKIVSVYSVYSLVSSGLRKVVGSVSSAIEPSLGRLIAKNDIEELNTKFNKIEFIYFMLVYFFFSVGIVAITPFVSLYTKGITDTNYYQPIFGYLLLVAEGIYTLRGPYVNLTFSANKFKDIKKYAYLEALVNIIVSVILVSKFGLIGVAIGTLTAMITRTILQVRYLKYNIIKRPLSVFIKKIAVFTSFGVIGFYISKLLTSQIYLNNSIINWLSGTIISSIIFIVIYLIMALLFYKNDIIYYKKIIFKIFKRKEKNNEKSN